MKLLEGKCHSWQVTQEEIDYVLSFEHCTVWLRDLDIKKIAEVQNLVLEENGEDKITNEAESQVTRYSA